MKPLIIPVFVPNQGCPNLCVFCNQKKISGVLHPPTQEDVREIIKTHLETFQDKKENKKCHRVRRPDATRGSGRSPDLPSLKKGDGSLFSKLNENNPLFPPFNKGGLGGFSTKQFSFPPPLKKGDKGGFSLSLNRPESNSFFKEVAFYGGSFTGLDQNYQKKLLETAKDEIDKGLIDGIRVSTRPDYIDDERLEILKNYGVKTIELGVQSLSDKVLESSKRGHDSSSVLKASKLIKEYGFNLGIQLMMGLPDDNEDSLKLTVSETIRIKPDFVRIYPVLVLKETELELLYYKGMYKPLTLEETVKLGKDILERFYRAGIPVIRFGLQPTDNVNLNNDVVAGPCHPSLRHIIDSELAYEKMKTIIEVNGLSGKQVAFSVPQKELSLFKGLAKENITRLKKACSLEDIKII